VLLFVLSIILAWYVGGAIGWCWCSIVNQIIENAEKRQGCKGCPEHRVPIDLEEYASENHHHEEKEHHDRKETHKTHKEDEASR
jgi:hypothetical protein